MKRAASLSAGHRTTAASFTRRCISCRRFFFFFSLSSLHSEKWVSKESMIHVTFVASIFSPLPIHQMRAVRISMVSRAAADVRHNSHRHIPQSSEFQTFIFFRYANQMPQTFPIKPRGRSFFSSFSLRKKTFKSLWDMGRRNKPSTVNSEESSVLLRNIWTLQKYLKHWHPP